MEFEHLIKLADVYGAHVQRSDATIARRAGLHTRFFSRLREGEGCTAAGFNRALAFFDERWPVDLAWPQGVLRPKRKKRKAA